MKDGIATEKDILREKMLASAIFLTEREIRQEVIWSTLWVMAGRPFGCHEDHTLTLMEKEDWKLGQLVDHILSYV